MLDPTRDATIARVADTLRATPPVSAAAKARILDLVDLAGSSARADGGDERAADADPVVRPLRRADGTRVTPPGLRVNRPRTHAFAFGRPALVASTGALAAALIGFVARDLLDRRTSPAGAALTAAAAPMTGDETASVGTTASTGPTDAASARTGVSAASGAGITAMPIPTQFVLSAPKAARVSLVGEFNDWDPARAPLAREAGGAWSIVVPLLPGRHVYAFVVDDSLWTLDPRAARVNDPDFGRPGSVVLVGRP